MAKEIVTASKLPLATAKEKDGIVLYWVEELGIAGIHQRGVSKLLDCNPKTVAEALKGVKEISLLESEIITPGGLQGVTLIPETDLAKLLRHIARSRAKEETRDRADDIRDRLAAAGFKLMVMMELAPAELAARAVSHMQENDRLRELELENENLKLRSQWADRQDMRIALHGISTALLLEGKQDAVVEVDRPTIEIIDERSNSRYEGQTLAQVAEHLKKTRGIKFKSGKEIARTLEKNGLGHLIAQTPRSVLSEYIPAEHLSEVYLKIGGCIDRQLLIGEHL